MPTVVSGWASHTSSRALRQHSCQLYSASDSPLPICNRHHPSAYLGSLWLHCVKTVCPRCIWSRTGLSAGPFAHHRSLSAPAWLTRTWAPWCCCSNWTNCLNGCRPCCGYWEGTNTQTGEALWLACRSVSPLSVWDLTRTMPRWFGCPAGVGWHTNALVDWCDSEGRDVSNLLALGWSPKAAN